MGKLWKGWKHPGSQGETAVSHLGAADLARVLIMSKGMNLLTVKPYVSLLLESSVNKADTYCCKSPIPNSGRHIEEVFSFHLEVFQPAGNTPTGSSSAVLSGWSNDKRREG